jgi:hypothetical protein
MADTQSDLPLFPPDPSAPRATAYSRRYKILRRAGYFFGSLILCFLVVHYGRMFGPKAWGSLRLVNTVVNLTPTLLSILFAFVVDKDLADRMKWRWLFRFTVISIGAGLSMLLWHQQALSDIQSNKQIQDAVTQAVTDANKHSDKQFQAVQQNVGGVDRKVSAVGDSLAQTATDLSSDIQRTSDAIQKTSDRLDASIGKVGKPDPPIPAKLVFSLWDAKSTSDNPTLKTAIQPDKDGSYPVDFTFINDSSTTAETIDFWIQICDQCSFEKEPEGFEKLAGSDEHVRHRMAQSVNPGVALQKMTVAVKPPVGATGFDVAFRYSCKTCAGKVTGNQIARVTLLPATPQ